MTHTRYVVSITGVDGLGFQEEAADFEGVLMILHDHDHEGAVWSVEVMHVEDVTELVRGLYERNSQDDKHHIPIPFISGFQGLQQNNSAKDYIDAQPTVRCPKGQWFGGLNLGCVPCGGEC